MNKIALIDIYKKSNSRISKDTAGGYGTENDFGKGILPYFLKRIVKYSLYWPNLMFAQLYAELKRANYDVYYFRIDEEDKIDISKYDYVFICNSIVCFESEINFVNNLPNDKKVFICGNFFKYSGTIIKKNWCILTGNYDFFVAYLITNKTTISDVHKNKILEIPFYDNYDLFIPDWINDFKIRTKNYLFGHKFYIPYLSTRGCPYSCSEYCTYPLTQGKMISSTNHLKVLSDLKEISKKDPYAHIVFRDPVFSINKDSSKKLLRLIINEKFKISFTVELHLKNLDDELIELLKQANVQIVKFGIESPNETIRDGVKRFSIKNSEQKILIDKLRKRSIKTIAMYILCQPDDNIKTANSTINYAIKLNTTMAQFSIFTPYPGTPFYEKNKHILLNEKFENYNQYNLVFKHKYFTPNSAKSILGKAYTKYYLFKILGMS